MNNRVISALHCVYRRQRKLQNIAVDVKATFCVQFASTNIADLLQRISPISRLQSDPHLVSAQHDRCSSDKCSITTHPAIQTCSLTTMQVVCNSAQPPLYPAPLTGQPQEEHRSRSHCSGGGGTWTVAQKASQASRARVMPNTHRRRRRDETVLSAVCT